MSRKAESNPFYALVVVTGLVFVLTVLMYVVTLVRMQAPATPAPAGPPPDSPVLAFFERRGETLMLCEAAALTIAAILAMGLDRWRSCRAACVRDTDPGDHVPSTPSSGS